MPSRIFLRSSAALVLPVLVASACAVTAVACSGLKASDAPLDAAVEGGADEASIGDDASAADSSTTDGALPGDAGGPPLDFECTTDPWTKTIKGKKECEARQVKVVESPAPTDVRGITIARTPAGRVGIAYNAEQDADTGEMHLVHFVPTTPTYPAPKLIVRATGLGMHDGYEVKLAASAPDTLALLAFDAADTQQGELHLRKLVNGTEPLTDSLVATGVKNPTEIAFGSDLAGNTVAAYRFATNATTSKLMSKRGTPAGVFTALPDLTSALHPNDAAGVGMASIFVDPGAQVHLLYHHNDNGLSPQFTQPRYHTLAGSTWSGTKTINNNVPDGVSGFSPSIAVFGTKKYAAFFFVKAVVSGTITADLRLATWQADLDVPTTEILDTSIPTTLGDALNPAYRVVIAVDKFGLLHLAILRPTDEQHKNGYLEYRRQTREPGGGTKWLSDIVDPTVFGEFSTAYVAMVVDENARPHIAYRSGKDDIVRYATRFDRP